MKQSIIHHQKQLSKAVAAQSSSQDSTSVPAAACNRNLLCKAIKQSKQVAFQEAMVYPSQTP
jgi:hypothetical protein